MNNVVINLSRLKPQSVAKVLLALIVSCVLPAVMSGQGKTLKLGIELQGYPTGAIPGVRADLFFSDFSKAHVRVGYNIVRHGDAGEHDDERGGGPGFTLGYDILPLASHRLTVGARCDLWFNQVDWYDILPDDSRIEGTTDVTVLQPTAQAGYRIPFGEKVELLPTLALGYEINIKTDGAEVGHGLILLAGFILNYEF